MEDAVVWIIGAIIVIALALTFWPITLCLAVAYIAYCIYKKNKLDTLNGNLLSRESRLSSTQNEITSVEKQRENLTARISVATEEKQHLNADYIEVSRFSTFFSEFFGTDVFPRAGIQMLEERMEKQAQLCADLETQNKQLAIRTTQLQKQSQLLTEGISLLKSQINTEKNK